MFLPAWESTGGNDGYVSFELDPLLEDPQSGPSHAQRVAKYIELGKQWSAGHKNRMIKVPATPAGLDALEELCAAGITLNVTLIFSDRQYRLARAAIWRGAQRRKSLDHFKSVYSIFVSRLDVYTEQHVPKLSPAAQGMVGIVNAKRIWAENRQFWSEHRTALAQEMIFASTGTKKPNDPAWKYVAAFAGSDIETNPPATNEAVQKSGLTFTRQIDVLPEKAVLDEIDRLVSIEHLEANIDVRGLEEIRRPAKSAARVDRQETGRAIGREKLVSCQRLILGLCATGSASDRGILALIGQQRRTLAKPDYVKERSSWETEYGVARGSPKVNPRRTRRCYT